MMKFRILTLILVTGLGFVAAETVDAQSNKKSVVKKVKKKVRRKRNLVIEKTYKIKKGKEKTNFDFDAADISGARKTPFGELVDTVQADRSYNFIKLRTNWRPEMERSAATLETGAGRK